MNEPNVSPKRALPIGKTKDVVFAAVSEITAADAMAALTKIVEAVHAHNVERTKREKIRVYADTEIARIRASERVLREYFDRVFDERRETTRGLFDRLDIALESGDASTVKAVVDGIVDVARDSPLANLGNLSELRAALDDPNTVFEF